MPEQTIKLTGWQAIVGIVILTALIGVRVMTMTDKKNDQALMKQLDVQIMCDYYPDLADRIKSVQDTDNAEEAHAIVQSVTSTKPVIESVTAGSALFDFSSPKKVVVRVIFSLEDDAGTIDHRTRYYLFEKSLFGWHFKHETTAVSYYLNFI